MASMFIWLRFNVHMVSDVPAQKLKYVTDTGRVLQVREVPLVFLRCRYADSLVVD